MKKVYAKPMIVFENFSLSTNIAGDCEFDTPLPSREENCAYRLRGYTVFTANSICLSHTGVEQVDGGYVYDNKVCYHVPTETTNLFNS